jgi:hypothetical protein
MIAPSSRVISGYTKLCKAEAEITQVPVLYLYRQRSVGCQMGASHDYHFFYAANLAAGLAGLSGLCAATDEASLW